MKDIMTEIYLIALILTALLAEMNIYLYAKKRLKEGETIERSN